MPSTEPQTGDVSARRARPDRAARRRRAGGLTLALASLVSAPAAWGLAQVPGPIVIGPNWASVNGQGDAASLFTRIANHGQLADRLTAADCPAFGHLDLTGLDPATQGDRGAEQGVLIPARAVVTLTPQGPHIAATEARHQLPEGMLISCTLSFVHAGQRIVVFSVGPERPVTDEP